MNGAVAAVRPELWAPALVAAGASVGVTVEHVRNWRRRHQSRR
jgi:hypothetical protein